MQKTEIFTRLELQIYELLIKRKHKQTAELMISFKHYLHCVREVTARECEAHRAFFR